MTQPLQDMNLTTTTKLTSSATTLSKRINVPAYRVITHFVLFAQVINSGQILSGPVARFYPFSCCMYQAKSQVRYVHSGRAATQACMHHS